MNPFSTVSNQAKNNGLPVSLQARAAYYQSEAFRLRTLFTGENAAEDAAAVSFWMLKRVALHPDYAQEAIENLKKGVLFLKYFGISSPVSQYIRIEDPHAIFSLLKAVRENMNSKMFKAAVRLRAIQNEHQKFMFASKMIRAEIASFSAKQTWASPQDYSKDPQAAKLVDSLAHALVDQFANGVKQRRLDRINSISRATAPGVSNWFTLLHLICAQVLTPESDIFFTDLLYQSA